MRDIIAFSRNQLHTMKKLYLCARNHWRYSAALFCDIPLETMPQSTVFTHPFGVVIGNATFGERCIIRQGVTIGDRYSKFSPDGMATIGNDVSFGAHSTVLGEIVIGDGAKIGAGAIVLADVPPGATVIGVWKG